MFYFFNHRLCCAYLSDDSMFGLMMTEALNLNGQRRDKRRVRGITIIFLVSVWVIIIIIILDECSLRICDFQ